MKPAKPDLAGPKRAGQPVLRTLVGPTFKEEHETPGEIFKEEHENLLEKSLDWLKDTAESCSVVAALIAGLSFATPGNVPGGNKDSGKPALEGEPAFEGFAISSLIGLYSSGTALIMFLSILTSRKQINDFDIIPSFLQA
ncbi:hypothetical protein TSUD_130530 [Trifolium subterraneum]|nr:hypothetical protein TSUD_130530 [Trifolium subterraneum]